MNLVAQFYNGSGVGGGINLGNSVPNGGGSIRSFILEAMFTVLSYMGLVAFIIICIGGIYLLVSGADEGTREKVRTMLFYLIIGLLLILIADTFVILVSSFG